MGCGDREEVTYAAMICFRVGMTEVIGNVEMTRIQKSWGRVDHVLRWRCTSLETQVCYEVMEMGVGGAVSNSV